MLTVLGGTVVVKKVMLTHEDWQGAIHTQLQLLVLNCKCQKCLVSEKHLFNYFFL